MHAPAATQQLSAKAHAIRERVSLGTHRYVLAGLSVLAGIGVEVALNPSPPLTLPLLVSLFTVTVTAYLAGCGPALFATAANLLVNCYLFAEPRFSLAVADPRDRWRLIVFAGAAIGVSLLSRRLSGTRHFPRVALFLLRRCS